MLRLLAILILILIGGGLLYILIRGGVAAPGGRQRRRFGNLRERVGYEVRVLEPKRGEGDPAIEEGHSFRARSIKRVRRAKKDPTVEELLFMAGRYTEPERATFLKARRKGPIFLGVLGLVAGLVTGATDLALLGAIFGVLIGLYLPIRILRGWVEKQHEELLYFLPLMIEQISIGVSSSLDIGPCISRIVQMSDERGTHNPAVDLLKVALSYVKSGVSLEQALVEVGRASGCAEFKQALLALAQVTKFGGEISRQLQELADSINSQREARIEAEIRGLELKATGPVSMVFLAYLLLLGLGIAAQFMTGVGG